MLKSEKGITIITLVITLIVMAILAGVTIATLDIITRAETQKIHSEMILIQTKVRILMEKAAFAGDTETYYIGTKLKDQADKATIAKDSLTASELNQDTLYIYNQETLNSIGLGSVELEIGEVYIVNYANGDVIYPNGVKNVDNETIYRLSEF